MKKIFTASYLALTTLLFFSCNKNASEEILAVKPEPQLESAIYPVLSKPGIMALGTEQSICAVGDNVTLFLPYKVVSEDIQEATLTIKDATTGEVLRELPMSFSTDLSIVNLTVPEELQGQTFLFANTNIENDFLGRKVTVSTSIKATSLKSDDTLENAFQIQ